jgi:hypothetical protein
VKNKGSVIGDNKYVSGQGLDLKEFRVVYELDSFYLRKVRVWVDIS